MRPLTTSKLSKAICLVGLVALAVQPHAASYAEPQRCLPGGDSYTATDLGSPDAQGAVRTATMGAVTDKLGYTFTVPAAGAASLYIGDQWFDLDLFLYVQGACPMGAWESLVRAWSVRGEQRVIQLIRPNEQIVNVKAGNYLLLAGHVDQSDPRFRNDFDPSHSFTVRVALTTPYCNLDPADVPVPNPTNPAVMMLKRPDEALYQLGLTIDPPSEADRGQFALLTFTAFISPPYTDLYDFSWLLDGQRLANADGPVYQAAVSDLPRTTGGQHAIQVNARGARVYPDPEQPSIPPDLATACSFRVSA